MENKAKIMIIDDDISMMNMLSMFLSKYGHSVIPFTEPISALKELKENNYDILLINYLITPINGDKLVEIVREFDQEIYIIMMSVNKDLAPSIETMNKLDIQAYYEKGSRFDQLILTIQSGIKYLEQIKKIKEYSIQLEEYIMDFATVLLNTVDAKDQYTRQHSQRVSNYAVKFAKYLKLNEDEIKNLKLAGLFHDIGKIGIPDQILTKESRLTDEEYETVQLHALIGSNILSVSDMFKDVSPIMATHHERVDGKGYPNGLKEDEIPYLGKILAIVDTFDAITTRRSYKEEKTIDFAIKELKRSRGTQLDKELVDKFIKFINTDKENFLELS